MVLGFTAAGSLSFYTFTTYMQKYLVNTTGMHANVASVVMTVALLVFMLIQPIVGALSDKIGRRTSMLIFGGMLTRDCSAFDGATAYNLSVCRFRFDYGGTYYY